MKLRFSLLLCLILALGLQVMAQDDVVAAELNEVMEFDVEEGRNEFFLEFEATAGDVVYLFVGAQELTFDDEVELEFRDADDGGIGISGELILDPYAIAVIEEDGTYTAVVDYRAEEDNVIDVMVGTTSFLGETPVTLEVGNDAFVDVALINVEDDGEFLFTMAREDGDLAVSVSVLNISESFPISVVDISGSGLLAGSALIELEGGEDYLVLVGSSTFSTYSYFPPSDEAEISLSLTPAE